MKGPVHAYVLAGDRRGSRAIGGVNKALLMVGGRPMFIHVLSALEQVKQVDRIYVVGPKSVLLESIDKQKDFRPGKKIEILEQREHLLENAAFAFAYSLAGCSDGMDPETDLLTEHREAVGLFLPADVPLLMAEEVEEFIAASDMQAYDYCMGVTSEEILRTYYPREGRPGIRMACFYLREKAYRINNLHLVRPYRIGKSGYIERMYTYRYQRNVRNVLRVTWELLGTRRWLRAVLYYGSVQAALFFSALRMRSMAAFFRRFLKLENLELAVSDILGTRFKTVETSFGGAALDIDDEQSYRSMVQMFDGWMVRQRGSLRGR